MKVIVSQEQIDKMKKLIDRHGIDSLGIEPYKLIEMGLIESYDDLWLDLGDTPIESLGNLKYVDGGLILSSTSIKNLGNLEEVGDFLDLSNSKIESLGNLEKVGGYLDLQNTPIESLGNLKYVGGYLNLEGCPLSKLSDEEIRRQVKIKGRIYRG
jgi:hypothetical protein